MRLFIGVHGLCTDARIQLMQAFDCRMRIEETELRRELQMVQASSPPQQLRRHYIFHVLLVLMQSLDCQGFRQKFVRSLTWWQWVSIGI